jgi:hypothetical protein
MLPHSIWKDLDRLPFYENAILLEINARSQGKSTRTGSREDDPSILPGEHLSAQMVRDLIDDFALVVAGNGGKDNVSAVCMEIHDEEQIVVLRVARNEASMNKHYWTWTGLHNT